MYLHESNQAHRTQSRVNGHLGKSVIQNLLDVSLPDSIIIDYLITCYTVRTRESDFHGHLS